MVDRTNGILRPTIPVGMAAMFYDIKDDRLKYIHWEAGHYAPTTEQMSTCITYEIENPEQVPMGFYGNVYACCAELEALGVERIFPTVAKASNHFSKGAQEFIHDGLLRMKDDPMFRKEK